MTKLGSVSSAGSDEESLALKVAERIRQMLIAGEYRAGEKLSEQQVSQQFEISRNTLREVFRILTSQRLLVYVPNRGVFVAAPDEAAVIDLYRVRSIIQKGAILLATKAHPAVAQMRSLVDEAKSAGEAGDWMRVGTLNMAFHRSMVDLCDSERLSAWFDLVLAELRLIFGQVGDGPHLHERFTAMNEALVAKLEQGDIQGALTELDAYLFTSERAIHAAIHRVRARTATPV
ncbi:GntR family transcriptional regulator [Paraburkholderia sp. UYCP14C]|uniref:GntR family transcriptional regulator n=1 Tax=Paraburkholderia sp. UYCP14C TaxID=2511130 RepID=UPI0010218D93|nr:GntR family transcriptional regulator [Paraburkholderia sp. UYCP14C]RZF24220.1 GntR family transcriptional regulator [Paraburkholderia sp. UYCP14C]